MARVRRCSGSGRASSASRWGGNAVRAVGQLAALSGNLGRPGAGFLYLNGAESRGIDEDYVVAPGLARGEPEPVSHMDLVARLEDPARSRALICWNINIAASNPEQARLRARSRREDLFTVVVDLFETDTTDLADVVLPAASFLESDDLVASYFHLCLGAQVKAARTARPIAPEQRDLPPARRGDGLHRARAVRERPLGHRPPARPQRRRPRLRGARGASARSGRTASRGSSSPICASRRRAGGSSSPPTRAAADGHPRVPQPHADRAAGATGGCGCSRRPRVGR